MRACMLAYTFYETDGRVKRYAEALAGRGDEVDVIALRRNDQPETEVLNGVRVFRIQGRVVNEKGKLTYLARLMKFFANSAWFVTRRHLRERYDIIHVHSVPDFEVFATLIPRLTGAKVILDIHDIVPEFYASKFNVSRDSAVFKALVLVEKASSAFSNHVIIANHIWHKVITARSIKPEKCTTLLNYPDAKFYQDTYRRAGDGKFVMLYPGTLNWHQGLDIAVKAFARVAGRIPAAEFHIIGEGPSKEMLRAMIADLGLEQRILLRGFVPQDEIVSIMAEADLGIVPKRANSFGNEAFSTKIFEFMALGVPVIVSDTKIDKYYFNDTLVRFFKAGDEEDLARNMLALAEEKETRSRLITNATAFIKQHSWDEKKQDYFDLISRITGNSTHAH